VRKSLTFWNELVVTIAISWLMERYLITSFNPLKMAGEDTFSPKRLKQILTNWSMRCSGTSIRLTYDR
jgi:hypothetical protein